jgi:pimeloyl-ACP methyl ester carboxylesterase
MTIDESKNLETCRDTRLAGAEIVRRFVELDGRRVSYLTVGDSAAMPTILLIHGSGVSARYWINQLRGLGGALRVVAIDLPGHGESDPMQQGSVAEYGKVLANFLDALGTGPVIAAGHSLGGAIAIALAVRRPDAVRGLVLLSSCAKLPRGDGLGERFLAYLPGSLRKILFFSMAKKILFAPGTPGGAVSLGMQELRSCRPETILKDVQAAKTIDLSEQATRLDVPTLILCGSRDRLTPPALAERLSELIRGSRLRIIDGAGHMLLLEVPECVNQEILNFVASIVALADVPSFPAVEDRPRRSLVRRLLDWACGIGQGLMSEMRARSRGGSDVEEQKG